jgi:hypothetical protein
MRAVIVALAGVIGFVAVSPSAIAVPITPENSAIGSAQNLLPVVRCPNGWHWVPAGYAKHAKWRPSHCTPN